MSFDIGRAQQLHSAVFQSVSADDIDGELVLDALDQLQFGWERITLLEQRVAALENECRRVGTF